MRSPGPSGRSWSRPARTVGTHGGRCGTRSRWLGGTARTRVAGMWGWPPRWCTRCRVCCGRWSAGTPASGGSRIIARETAHLSPEHRAQIDAAIADQLHAWGDARTEREARAWAQRLDPYGAADRARKAEGDRRVSIRPAPDCMTYLTALLPVKEGCAVFGELHRKAMAAAVDPGRAPVPRPGHGRHADQPGAHPGRG